MKGSQLSVGDVIQADWDSVVCIRRIVDRTLYYEQIIPKTKPGPIGELSG